MTQGQAKRLVYESGQWTLEVEQLKVQGRQLYRPQQVPVLGPESILAWLKSHQPELFQSASRLIVKDHPADCLAYKAEGKSWTTTAFSPAVRAASPDGQETQEDATDLTELRQHLFVLEARLESLHKLERRVAVLEQKLHSAGAVSAAVQPGASGPVAPVVAAPASAAAEDPAPVTPPAAPQTTPEEEVTLANAEAPVEKIPKADEGPAPEPREDRLDVPTVAAMKETIAALLGTELEMSEDVKLPLPALGELGAPSYICQIIDDAGEIEGLILSDLEATVRLGGSLMMTPAEEIANQIANATPSEDVVDAAAEIFNNLSGVLNAVEGNKHIKVDTARPLVESEHPWLNEPYVRHDFKIAEGGRLVYLFK